MRTKFPARSMLLIAALALVAALIVVLPKIVGSPASAQDGEPKVPTRPTGLRVTTEAGSLDVAVVVGCEVEGATSYKVRWRVAGRGQRA